MGRLNVAALLTVPCLTPVTSRSQERKVEQAERKISRILAELDEENRGYGRELRYFERLPESGPLSDIHGQLTGQTAKMRRLETGRRGSGPAILRLAREMDHAARKLEVETSKLEERAEAVSGRKGCAVAGRMKSHARAMVKAIEEVVMFR